MLLSKPLVPAALVALASATKVAFPSSPPSNAALVNPAFPGTSFELSTFQLYAETSTTDHSANQYSVNLIKEIFKRTGVRPILRVGGTTGDTTTWLDTLVRPTSPAPGTPETGALTIGPNYWPMTQLLKDTNALWVPQIGYTDQDPTHAVHAAQSIMSSIGLENLAAIEIGNEPNEYGGHSGPTATNATHYAERFQEIVANISGPAGIPSGAIFSGSDLASVDHHDSDWTVEELFTNTNIDATGNIKYAADHWYRCIGQPCDPVDLINHASTVANTEAHIGPAADFFKTYNGGSVKYYLDEINVLSGTPDPAFSFSFAIALYGVDFMMYLMTRGVDSVNWEQVFDSNQNVWQPSSSSSMEAQTKNIYYALITAAEFIGSSGATKVVEIPPTDNDGTKFSAYAAFDGNSPARMALCNLNYWDSSSGATRDAENIEIDGLPSNLTSITVKYLSNPGGAGQSAESTTFGGSQWPFSNLGLEQAGAQDDTVNVTVSNGVAWVVLPHSSVAMLYLE